jgi:threonine/homoserine/homoserine lactone efflux protein
MPTLQTLLLFMTAGLALNLTPGPDMLYVATRSTTEGRAAGLASALGIAVGCLGHLAALVFGLAALLAQVPTAYELVRWVGAAYLVYLGLRMFLRPPSLAQAPSLQRASIGAVFRQGVFTNLLNPKVALFFLAFLPQFIDPARGSPVGQMLLFGLLFNASGTMVNAAVAVLASRATDWLRAKEVVAQRLQRASGVVFLALGARLACARRG